MRNHRTSPMQHLLLDRFIPFRLSVLTNKVSGAIARHYSERFGLSIPEWRVMAVLGETPGLSAREAATKVEVKDGETVVLAGIKQSRRTKITTKVPILGSIPLLGLLFRHKEEDVTQTSLVFFVTFRLVK